MTISKFEKASPVWIMGKEKEMNFTAGFQCSFTAAAGKKYALKLTGAALYRVYCNGSFVHYGPARAPHGFTRIDIIDLTPLVIDGLNKINIEVAGYNCKSFYTLDIPSFIQAELLQEDGVIAFTSVKGSFTAAEQTQRVQKVMRYSFQRAFTEVYNLYNPDAVPIKDQVPAEELIEVAHGLKYLPRIVPLPDYDIRKPAELIEKGKAEALNNSGGLNREYRFIHNLPEWFSGFDISEITQRPFEVIQKYEYKGIPVENSGLKDIRLDEGEYILLDMGLNNNGFIMSDIKALEDSEVYLVFDEKLIDGKLDINSWDFINVVKYRLSKADRPYTHQTFETYGFKYLMYFVEKGSIILQNTALREYSYPLYKNAEFRSSDPVLNAIFAAAVETYRQNTLDVFMDCPTRERAGWLCDSYFTAQASLYFSGDGAVEKVMLENYLLNTEFAHIPGGMLPMCYPAEHPNGNFIPQWAMWYVIQLEGYFKRYKGVGKEKFRSLCYSLINLLNTFRNSDGLLEKLPKWNFIEWSRANDWVQDVHYPTNMLYARVLELTGTWYGDAGLLEQASTMRKKIIEQSFDGCYFIDNALRNKDGSLSLTDNRSEVGQYFACFFGPANPQEQRYSKLTDTILHTFGPDRKKNGLLPDIAPANAFIGNYLRMELLSRWGRYQQALEEAKKYFCKMAQTTGTLWENDNINGSLNHGFASFIGVIILRCAAGIYDLDSAGDTVVLSFKDTGMDEVTARVGTSLGDIRVDIMRRDGRKINNYIVPEGLIADIRNEEYL